MIRGGLVSISFRKLSAEQIIAMMSRSPLIGIEWGGDIHVPHGDIGIAERVGRMTRDAGLEVAAYGSYYKLGESESGGLSFGGVLDSALALKAPTVRVWAGSRSTRDAGPDDWDRVVEDAQRIADLGASARLRICIEYHRHTLTDHHEAAITLHTRIARDNVDLLWQPPYDHDHATQLAAIEAMLPRVSNLHVYAWRKGDKPDEPVRLPLRDAVDQWRPFIDVLARSGRNHYAMLEYVKDDDPEQFRRDAETLCALLN